MKTVQMILSGVGGQGILFATRILTQAALRRGMDVIGSETHGMAQRGGSVISHLKIGPFSGPLVGEGRADILLAFEENEAYRTLGFLRQGGLCFVNAGDGFPVPRVGAYCRRWGIEFYTIPATQMALHEGLGPAGNLILLGYATSFREFPFQPEDLLEEVRALSPARFMKANIKAFRLGMNYKTD